MEKKYYLRKLQEILDPGNCIFDSGNNLGWKQIESDLGIELPIDYKEYIKVYGTGGIDNFLWILTPFCKDENVNFIHKAINEQILKNAQSYPTNAKTSSSDAPFLIN